MRVHVEKSPATLVGAEREVPAAWLTSRAKSRLTFRDPRTYRSKPGTIKFWRARGGVLILPRAFPWEQYLKPECVGWRLDLDETVVGESFPFQPTSSPRPHQVEAVRATTAQDGILVAECGAGKTVTLLLAAAAIGRVTVVLVHTGVLLEQWRAEAVKHLGLRPDQVGTVGEGKVDVEGKPLVIALVQSVSRGADLGSLPARAGLVITDECHHASAPTWVSAITRFPARRRLGASATPRRRDGLEDVFHWHIGPVVARMDPVSMVPEIRVLETAADFPPATLRERIDWRKVGAVVREVGRVRKCKQHPAWEAIRGYCRTSDMAALEAAAGRELAAAVAEVIDVPNRGKLLSAIAAFPTRQTAIEACARSLRDEGRTVVILVDRKDQAVALGEMLADLDVAVCLGSATMEQKARLAAVGVLLSSGGRSEKAKARRREALGRDLVVATGELVKEGFDNPRLDAVVDACVYADPGRALQSAGRALRPLEGKRTPVVVVLRDAHPKARDWADARLRAYRDAGYLVA